MSSGATCGSGYGTLLNSLTTDAQSLSVVSLLPPVLLLEAEAASTAAAPPLAATSEYTGGTVSEYERSLE